MIFDDLGEHEEALADFQAILSIDPHHADAITNRGILHGRRGEFRDALACYDQSLALNSEQPNAWYNRAVVRLVLGDWRQGFRDFESRWRLFPHEAARLTRLAPLWSGERDVAGKTILLHHEQGFGDTLQFCRYAPLVMGLGARVIVASPAGLRRLLTTLPGSPQIVSEGEPVPAHDFHCPLMSLPLAFGTTPDTAPARIPYLRADACDVKHWGRQLGERRRPRVGIVWSGRRFPPINYARDMTLETIQPLFALDADFTCLQTDLSEAERSTLAPLSNVTWWGEGLKDFADTAALVENLDLVITVDSAVAHLTGALGKPVWLMNRYASCWRWLLERTDSPWYPSMRLFRQSALGDWASVVQEVVQACAQWMRASAVQRVSGPPVGSTIQSAPDLAIMLQKALDLHHGGDLAQAVATYRGILDWFPDQFETLHYLGVALAQKHQYEDALEALARAIRIRPESAVAHNHCGHALAGLSRHTEAIQSYERAILCDDRLADSHYNRGVASIALGDRESALAAFDAAIARNADYAQAFNNRGIVLSELGRVEEALADYDRAIEVQPDFVDARVNRSDLLRRLHRHEALQCSENALEQEPSIARARM
jgi:tetratricopeptide (TPR) repeat protein